MVSNAVQQCNEKRKRQPQPLYHLHQKGGIHLSGATSSIEHSPLKATLSEDMKVRPNLSLSLKWDRLPHRGSVGGMGLGVGHY